MIGKTRTKPATETRRPPSDHYWLAITRMSVGAFNPPENGEPLRGETIPVDASTEKAETLLSTLLTTNRNVPVGSRATPNGCCPVGTSAIKERLPFTILNSDKVPACTLVE